MAMRTRLLLCLSACLLILACEPDTLPMQSGHLQVNGTRIFYKSLGAGDPILVLHGGPGMDHQYLLPYMGKLAVQNQLVFFDQRGCGQSSYRNLDSTNMSMAAYIADISALADSLGLERFHLMGHSWGGLLAMWFATRHPERLESLILVNSIGADQRFAAQAMQTQQSRFSARDKMEMEKLMHSEALQTGDPEALEKMYRMSFAATVKDRRWLDSLKLQVPSDASARQKKLGHLYRDLGEYDLHPRLSRISCPALIIHGDYDATPLEAMELVAKHLPDARLEVLHDCGHFAYVEQQAAFQQRIHSFLSQINP